MAIQDDPNDKYLSISGLKHFFLYVTNLSMHLQANNCKLLYATSWKSDIFSILDSAYAILVLCSRQVLVMFKDHPSKLISSIGSHWHQKKSMVIAKSLIGTQHRGLKPLCTVLIVSPGVPVWVSRYPHVHLVCQEDA